MWAIARIDLELEEKEIGPLTLVEFDALLKRERERRHREQLTAGTIASTVWNARAFRSKEDPWVSALDFFPDIAPAKPSGPQSIEEMAAEVAKGLGISLSKVN